MKSIGETRTWLENHLDDSSVRTKYLTLVEANGIPDEKLEAIEETISWLEGHQANTEVRTKYLALVERYGEKEEKRQAIAETSTWIKKHPKSNDVRAKYISFCGKSAKELEIEIEVILNEQLKWIENQSKESKVSSNIWVSILPALFTHLLEKSDLLEKAIKLVLLQHPDDLIIISRIIGYYRDYLEKDLYYQLAERIVSSEDSSQNCIHAANFFRDEGDFGKAESVYQRLLNLTKNNIANKKYLHTYYFTSLSYAQLLLLKGEPDNALSYLDSYLKQSPKNGLAYLVKAQCFQLKGQYNNAVEYYEKAIQFDKFPDGRFSYEYGCFLRNCLKDYEKAKHYFEESNQQQENLPAYLELSEIELENDNKEKSKLLLEKGLKVKLKKRIEKEFYQKHKNRILAIQQEIM